jgi:hypothetical protein
MATEDRIKETHPLARRTGWSATSDGLRIYFYAWHQDAVATWIPDVREERRPA